MQEIINMVDNPSFDKELIKKYKLKKINPAQPICFKCGLKSSDCMRYCNNVIVQKKMK